MAVVLQDSLNQLQPLAKSLVLDVELEGLCIFFLKISLNGFDVCSEVGICFQQVGDCIDTVDQAFGCCIHFLLVLLEIKVCHCPLLKAAVVSIECFVW